MERYSSRVANEASPEEPHKPNVEKVTEWLVGLQTSERAAKPKQETLAEHPKPKTERDFERRQEVLDEPQVIKRGGMVAVGEVLADRSSDGQPPILGVAGVRHASQQKKMAREERKASHVSRPAARSGLTPAQAVQVGIAAGIGVGLLILLWLSVR